MYMYTHPEINVAILTFNPQLFREAIKSAASYKENSTDFMDEVMRELEVCEIKQEGPFCLRKSTFNQ